MFRKPPYSGSSILKNVKWRIIESSTIFLNGLAQFEGLHAEKDQILAEENARWFERFDFDDEKNAKSRQRNFDKDE